MIQKRLAKHMDHCTITVWIQVGEEYTESTLYLKTGYGMGQ